MVRRLDVERLREDTPGCSQVTHLNNAGASLPPEPVLEAVIAHLRLEARMGGYEAADRAAEDLARLPRAAARLVGAEPDEVAFTSSATQAWQLAFWGLFLAGWFRPGDRILADRLSYVSCYLAFLQAARHGGVDVVVVPSEADGTLSLDALDDLLDERVRLVSLTHVGTHRGLVNPAAEVGRRTRDAGVPYFLDACQSVGQLSVDVGSLGCDVLAATGRKWLRAPRGTGFLYVRKELSDHFDPPGIDAHAASWVDARDYELFPGAARFEPFEVSYAGKIGLGVAIDYLLDIGVEAVAERVADLAESLREELGRRPGIRVHDGGTTRSGIVTFSVDGVPAGEIREHLAEHAVHVSVANAAAARLDMEAEGLDETVRASPHAFNTEAELQRLLDVLDALR